MSAQTEQGTISIHTENIFPIIKKSLYADTEIFIRELASNGVDACRKVASLAQAGKETGPIDELYVDVRIDKEARQLIFSDNGLGMTADEVKRYINQIAFSGASDFLERFKTDAQRSDIIGNFGLGFYSSFMVASHVELVTQSWQAEAETMRWTCDGSTQYTLEPATEARTRGTTVTLTLDADSDEFLEAGRVREVLTKYCRFLPVQVRFQGESIQEKAIWTQSPSSLTDEDYKSFYEQLYPMAEEPLFHIHLNVDHPFQLTGILYFPRVRERIDTDRHRVQLYSRQVFITEEVKGIVPDFLTLLHGVIDSPDIPLNVSRSYLQTDANVRKIAGYVTRKVADKLEELFRQDRPAYEAKWEALGFFVKYGLISDKTFAERAEKVALVKDLNGGLATLDEYTERTRDTQTDKNGQLVWLYTQDPDAQAVSIQALKERGYDVLYFDQTIDPHYLQYLESSREKLTIKRVDTAPAEQIIERDLPEITSLTDDEKASVQTLFTGLAGRSDKAPIKVASLLSTDAPVSLVKNEFMLRMEEMSRVTGQGMFGGMGLEDTLVINGNHPAIARLLSTADEEERRQRATYLIDLARLAQGSLTGEHLVRFIKETLSRETQPAS